MLEQREDYTVVIFTERFTYQLKERMLEFSDIVKDYISKLSEDTFIQKERASEVLKEELNSNKIQLLELKSCGLDVAYYNKMIGRVKNKSRVLFDATTQLIQRPYDNYGGDDLQVIVDRQGGRVNYRSEL